MVRPSACAWMHASALLFACFASAACSQAEAAPPSAPSSAAPQGPSQGQAALELRVALIRAGLAPQTLAAAGLTPVQVGTAVAALHQANVALPVSLRDLDHAVGEARNARDQAERLIQSGRADAQQIAAFPALEQALASASAARETAVQSLFAAATASLSATQRATLIAIRTNAHWKLPTEFLVVERSEVEWVALRNALANERIATRNGDTPNPQCQVLLGHARSDASVAAAKTGLDTNLAALQQTWDSVTSN